MAKRFTDSNKWDDAFFLDMPDKFKLLYLYILDKCDAVGVWKVNKRLAEFCIGTINWDIFVSYMGSRLQIIDEEKWWLVKFCEFQYGSLDENSNSPATKSHINLLKKHSLYIGYTRTIYSPKEKEKEKAKEKVKDSFFSLDEYFENCKEGYEQCCNDKEWIEEQEKFNPSLDILLSLEKSYTLFWGTEAGYKNKKASKSKVINWKTTFAKNLDKSKVYKNQQAKKTWGDQRPSDEEFKKHLNDLKRIDLNDGTGIFDGMGVFGTDVQSQRRINDQNLLELPEVYTPKSI